MKVSAIICAAGKGERAGFDKNKLLAPLYGAPALWHTLKKFDIPEIDEIIVTSSVCDFEEISSITAPFGIKVVTGGATRTESVKNALEEITGDIVLIHDGARPFVSENLILKCIDSVKNYGSGICAVRATDTIVYADGDIEQRLDRDKLYQVQTPQGFYAQDIKRAYSLAGNKVYTDDSAIYGEFIKKPRIVEGETENIKLTYKSDFMRGMPPSTSLSGNAIGFGVDVHAFGEGNLVTLAGVKIPCDKKLIAHSDGDVVIHAVMDALLSGAGLKDIGHYFPDTDDKFKGADSGIMLKKVISILRENGLTPVNLSISIQAEKPRLAKHIDVMKANLSKLTGVKEERIAIAAGTCEGLGFVGEGLGICAYCAVQLCDTTHTK
ncbi:MAG: 2-C-methyl-D-erythritol 4-phosphate cytidylyltransferase [Clostridia bacterium]|nr:2-C-methyl-D-erythritol 4-phosphate cytidylyltransferase [Clostridia bacterium]